MRYLFHSAKGSTWEDHKYIKRLNGTYYYPDSYKGGRHLPEGSASMSKTETDNTEKEETTSGGSQTDALQEEDIATLAMEVIRGNFGNGDVRKELLGKHYQQVQDRVNQILLGGTGSQPVASSDSDKKQAGERALQTVYNKLDKIDQRDSGTKKATAGLDLDKIYSVYAKQTKRK